MFGTSGVRGNLDLLPPKRMQDIGLATASCFDDVVVGRDARLTMGAMEDAFVSGLESGGADVTVLGVVPTNVVAWQSRQRECGGAMLTASHNPPGDAGVKLFEEDGGEVCVDVEEAIEEAMYGETATWGSWTGKKEEQEVVEAYLDEAKDYLESTFDGESDLDIALDAGCGVAADVTVPLLESLGCSVTAVNAQRDGRFPARPSKPTADTLHGFVQLVLREDYDLGFAHDGDGDRLVVVDGEGLVSEDGVLAAVARHRLRNVDEDLVVTTPNTSSRIDDEVEDAGGHVERVALGGLPEKLREVDAAFAAEPWKPVFPDWGPWIDGSVAAAYVAGCVAEDPGFFDGLRDIVITKASVDCPDELKTGVMEELASRLPEKLPGEVDASYGVRVDLEDEWFLVRPSGTEPLVRVYAESEGTLLNEVAEEVEATVDEVG